MAIEGHEACLMAEKETLDLFVSALAIEKLVIVEGTMTVDEQRQIRQWLKAPVIWWRPYRWWFGSQERGKPRRAWDAD